MAAQTFAYQAVLDPQDPNQVRSVIAYRMTATGPLSAVLWHASEKEWTFAPAIAASLLYDDQSRTTPIDRETAERIAREALATELPGEDRLDRMCQEGARLGHEWGPPRS